MTWTTAVWINANAKILPLPKNSFKRQRQIYSDTYDCACVFVFLCVNLCKKKKKEMILKSTHRFLGIDRHNV